MLYYLNTLVLVLQLELKKWSGRRPEATTSVVEVTAYPARLVTFNNLSWTINKQLQFCVLYGVSAMSLVAAYVSVTQSWVISPSSSNTNSVIADIIHEDGFVTGCTLYNNIRGLWELLTNFPNGRRWQKWLLLDSLVRTLREGILHLQSDLTPFLMKPEALDELPVLLWGMGPYLERTMSSFTGNSNEWA